MFFGVVSTFSAAIFVVRGLVGGGLYSRIHGQLVAHHGSHSVVAALDAVSEVLDETVGADVWSLSDDDLQATIVACERSARSPHNDHLE